jgi:uncharacterized integral membrane protein
MKPTKLKLLTVLLLSVILGFLILALFTGCSAEQRYKCLVKNHPELVETDTVFVTDTIIREVKVRVPEYKDSFIFKHDTTYETKEVIVYKKGDKVFLNVKPKEIIVRDTVPFEVKVPGKVITITKTNWNLLWIILIVGLVLGLLLKSR